MTSRTRVVVSERIAVLLAAGVLTLSWTQPARAAPTGIQGESLARGAFAPDERIDFKVQAHTDGHVSTVQIHDVAGDTVVQKITILPGGYTDWHTHAGPAIVVVTAGTLTIYDGDDPTCTGRFYGPDESESGAAFVDLGQGHVHNARNEGTTDVTVYVTYIDAPPGTPLIPADDPGVCEGF